MEEQQNRMDVKGFLKKFGGLIAAACFLVAALFLLAPVINYETKYYVGDEKVKEYFVATGIDLLSGKFASGWTMIITVATLCLAFCASIVSNFLKDEKWKENIAMLSTISGIVAVCFLFLGREFFGINADSIEHFNDASLAWGSAAAILATACGALINASSRFSSRPLSGRDIAEDGVLLAMAFVLNFIKIPVGADGGSINFQMLPLMVIALRRGPAEGFLCGGIVYGLLTCLVDGWGFASYPFDYLVGFGSVMVMGFFRDLILAKDQKLYSVKGIIFLLVGGILVTAVRFIGSSLSSMVIYGLELVPALEYNMIYIPLSGAIATAALIALYGPIQRLNKRF